MREAVNSLSRSRLLGRGRLCHRLEPGAYDGGDSLVVVLHILVVVIVLIFPLALILC